MRHQVAGRKLGKTTSHRWADFANMAASLVQKGRITTTLPKAKELRRMSEYLVGLGKRGNLQAKRRALSFVGSREVVNKIFSDLADRFQKKPGGYTRILRLGRRHGDGAPMAFLEYLPGKEGPKETKSKETKSKKGDKKKE